MDKSLLTFDISYMDTHPTPKLPRGLKGGALSTASGPAHVYGQISASSEADVLALIRAASDGKAYEVQISEVQRG